MKTNNFEEAWQERKKLITFAETATEEEKYSFLEKARIIFWSGVAISYKLMKQNPERYKEFEIEMKEFRDSFKVN